MKNYDRMMQNLRFREDFCESTLRKAQEPQGRPLLRGLATAACVCVCVISLIGTALAFPQIRALFFSAPTEVAEHVSLPEAEGDMMENNFELVSARYYKLEGELDAHEGIGSAIPVTKDGKTIIYSIDETGELKIADAPRTIQKEISYEGRTYSLDMQIFAGDVPTVVKGERIFPLLTDNTYVLGKKVGSVSSPLFVDLDTWEMEDPMANIDFVPPADAVETRVTANQGGAFVLIETEMPDDSRKIYYADRETGEVTFLEDAAIGEWFMYGGRVYRYRDGLLSTLNENGQILPLFGNQQCSYKAGSRLASVREGDNIRLLLLPTGEEIVFENGAELFGDTLSAQPNHALTKICVTVRNTYGSFNSDILAIADMETGEMVALERKTGLREQMCGWFDDETFMIAGTIGEEWYVCLYDVSE